MLSYPASTNISANIIRISVLKARCCCPSVSEFPFWRGLAWWRRGQITGRNGSSTAEKVVSFSPLTAMRHWHQWAGHESGGSLQSAADSTSPERTSQRSTELGDNPGPTDTAPSAVVYRSAEPRPKHLAARLRSTAATHRQLLAARATPSSGHCHGNRVWRGLETGETGGMKPPPDPHYRHRFPAEIISHAVWLYHVFSLSLRDVELLLAERGIVVSYETVRRWCKKFGQSFANRLRRRRPRPGDKWHLDEVFIRIQGVQHYLWRAVDQDGVVLDILVQPRRDAKAAKRFFRRLLKGLQYVPRVIVTDKLRSYGVAHRQLLPEG